MRFANPLPAADLLLIYKDVERYNHEHAND